MNVHRLNFTSTMIGHTCNNTCFIETFFSF